MQTPIVPPTAFLTTLDLADRLNVRPATIHRWVQRGIIPAIYINPKTVRFDFAAVAKALADRQYELKGGAK